MASDEPVSNLSQSVDISGELLSAAADTINSAIDTYQAENSDDIEENSENKVESSDNNVEISDESEQVINQEKILLPEDDTATNCNTQIVSAHYSLPVNDVCSTNNEEQNLNLKAVVEQPKFAIKAYTEQQLSALYTNSELNTLEQFTFQFVEAELKGLAIKQHPLYELLINYLSIKNKVIENQLEIQQLKKEYKEAQTVLWSLDSVVASGRAECQDGNVVLATYTYTKASFQRTIFQNIARVLASIRLLSNESHTLHGYSAEVLKQQVSDSILEIMSDY